MEPEYISLPVPSRFLNMMQLHHQLPLLKESLKLILEHLKNSKPTMKESMKSQLVVLTSSTRTNNQEPTPTTPIVEISFLMKSPILLKTMPLLKNMPYTVGSRMNNLVMESKPFSDLSLTYHLILLKIMKTLTLMVKETSLQMIKHLETMS